MTDHVTFNSKFWTQHKWSHNFFITTDKTSLILVGRHIVFGEIENGFDVVIR